MQFANGWVQELKVFVPHNFDNVVAGISKGRLNVCVCHGVCFSTFS